jgi:hypothetical protein
MTERRAYLAAAIRLYLQLPGAPRRASRADWAVANTLYQRGVSLETLAHVFRLASLRRHWPTSPLEPVRSLAYYRTVLEHLTPDALDPGYVEYIAYKHRTLFGDGIKSARQTALSDRQDCAVLGRR